LNKVRKLNEIALNRGQSLAQMSIAWILRNPEITTVLVGVSRSEQLLDNIKSLENLNFSTEELEKIESILNNQK
jgi:L-glyceraldehyde 3-phosphate reductase